MPNPNNPDKRAADKAAKASEAAFNADLDEAKAKAAQAEKIGTAEKPVEGSLNLGSVPSTDNLQAKWADEISSAAREAARDFEKNDADRLKVWRKLGAALGKIAFNFIKRDENGKPRKGKDGKIIKDNNAYSKWLDGAGLSVGVLKNGNTRSAAIWVAENWSKIKDIPAVMKHGHPGHARDAYTLLLGALDKAKAAYEGDDFDAEKFAADYEAPKKTAKGGTVPHSIDTCLIQIKASIAGGVSIFDYNAKGTNDQAALIILLRRELSKAQSEVARLTKDLEDAGFSAAAPQSEPKAKRTRKPKAKTENGDEIVPGEVALWEGRDSEADEIDGDFEEVKPVQGLLPPPDKDAGADAEADETL